MKNLIRELNKNMVTSIKFNPLEMNYTITTKDENDNKKIHYINENGKVIKKSEEL